MSGRPSADHDLQPGRAVLASMKILVLLLIHGLLSRHSGPLGTGPTEKKEMGSRLILSSGFTNGALSGARVLHPFSRGGVATVRGATHHGVRIFLGGPRFQEPRLDYLTMPFKPAEQLLAGVLFSSRIGDFLSSLLRMVGDAMDLPPARATGVAKRRRLRELK